MSANPLKSLADYSGYVADILDHPSVQHSTLAVWSDSPYTGIAEGEIYLLGEFRLRIREELDFAAGLITSYGYEVYMVRSDCIGMMTFHTPMTPAWRQHFRITSMCRRTSSITVCLPRS